MHTFAVVNARPGRRVPEHVRRILRSAAPAELTFPPSDHVHWTDDAERLHFAGWQHGAENLGVGSRWEVRPDGVTAFVGHTWIDADPWKPAATWASQLSDRLEDTSVRSLVERLDGVFSLLKLTRDGRGEITSDPVGAGVVYQGHDEHVTVFSNRAALVARLLAAEGAEPVRDVEGAVCIAYASNLQSERTTFVGVSRVPLGSVVELHPSTNPRVHVWSRRPWIDPDLAGAGDVTELIEPVISHMRRLVRTMASLPAPILTAELTGGRDSRMILSLLLAEDLTERFTFVTWGQPDLADVVIANQIADRFDLDLRATGRPRKKIEWRGDLVPRAADNPPDQATPSGAAAPSDGATAEPIALGFADKLRRHVWRTSGAVSVWDVSSNSRRPSPSLALTGQFGELLRTNYPRTGGLGSMADLDRFTRTGGFRFDAAGLLRRSAREHFSSVVSSAHAQMRPPGGTVQDSVDGYYQSTRVRTWFGAVHELDNRNRLFPLYNLPAVRAAFAIGSRARRLEALPFELIRGTCPELLTFPFASSGWPRSLVAGEPDADRYPTAPDPQPWTAPSWRHQRAVRRSLTAWRSAPRSRSEERSLEDVDQKIPVLREFLDLGPSHELYRYLDHDATMWAVANLGELHSSARRSLHDAVTAAMWLSGAEEREKF